MQLPHAFRGFLTTIARELERFRGDLASPGGRPGAMIIVAFRSAGAVNRRAAQRFHPRSDIEEAAFQQLLQSQVIRQPEPGRYFLDEDVLAALSKPRWLE